MQVTNPTMPADVRITEVNTNFDQNLFGNYFGVDFAVDLKQAFMITATSMNGGPLEGVYVQNVAPWNQFSANGTKYDALLEGLNKHPRKQMDLLFNYQADDAHNGVSDWRVNLVLEETFICLLDPAADVECYAHLPIINKQWHATQKFQICRYYASCTSSCTVSRNGCTRRTASPGIGRSRGLSSATSSRASS